MVKQLSEDGRDALRLLLKADGAIGWVDVGWDAGRWERAIAEIRACGLDVQDDRGEKQ